MKNAGDTALARLTALASVCAIGALALWGGYERRWMSDDGLIVLRTVRNLEAGNGPVFNVGERVEANTSVIWQYLIFAAREVCGAELESIAMALGLALSVAAVVIAAGATAATLLAGRGERPSGASPSADAPDAASRRRGAGVVLPAGALVYLALPPARDFFTSGLEWGLCIFYLAVLWALLVAWAAPRGTGRDWPPYALALWCGLSWLVRPELALYGGCVGLLLLCAHRSVRQWLGILSAALPIPAAYQVFRMGYYGLLTPHTAVAKSAGDAAWRHGWNYLLDFTLPYALYVPVAVLVAYGVWASRGKRRPPRLRAQASATYLMLGCALLHTVYVLRVGGDFMHGRMLLLPLFAALLPAFVLRARGLFGAAVAALCAAWALAVLWRGHPQTISDYQGHLDIVDEREYWTGATGRPPGLPPRRAADFLGATLMNGYGHGLEDIARDGDAMAIPFLYDPDGDRWTWLGVPRDPQRSDPPTLYLLNMGMTSMNAPLDVRVLDTMGLATPLAARQPREEGGRIGHDKHLDEAWQYADSGVDLDQLPRWVDEEKVRQARAALKDPGIQELFASYRDPLSAQRFWQNIKFSLDAGRTLRLSADPSDYLR